MAGNWSALLTKLIALALVVALSPVTVIPAVLVLHAPRPRPSGLAFLGGWLVSLSALAVAFIAASDMLDIPTTPPRWASWLRVIMGVALILFGLVHWFRRKKHAHAPAWMNSFTRLTPVRAGVTGAVLAVVRPEVLIVAALAGLAIGSSNLGAGGYLAAAVFVAVASITVAVPILAYAGAGHRLDDRLERLKVWMEQNSAALVAAVLFLIGLMVLYNGISKL